MLDSARAKIVLAFFTLYVVWGSTYLAIRIGVHELPPALFAAARWLFAAAMFALYARVRGIPWPRGREEWRTLSISGILLIVGGNGLVVWGEQWVPSNLAALIIATTALWIAGLGTLGARGEALAPRALAGLAIGFAGVCLLLWPQAGIGSHERGPARILGEAAVLIAALMWALGTLYGRRRGIKTPPIMATAMQMAMGGGILFVAGVALGEPARWTWTVTGMSALLYLAVFGSLGFLAYAWLLHRTTPAKLGTYAYVNPALAVLLGWWLLDEALNARQLLGTAIIIVGVGLVTSAPAVPARNNGQGPKPDLE